MSGGLPDTPPEIPVLCGFCDPDRDFDTYVHLACASHSPDLSGPDDAIAKATHGGEWITGTGEAGGHSNRDACEMIHQRRP